MKSVNVLGTEYTVREDTDRNDPSLKQCDGYCDTSIKLCVIVNPEHDVMSKKNMEDYKKRVTRHELVHAFLYESGLDTETFANDEEVVDWIAIQFPKMLKVFQELDCL